MKVRLVVAHFSWIGCRSSKLMHPPSIVPPQLSREHPRCPKPLRSGLSKAPYRRPAEQGEASSALCAFPLSYLSGPDVALISLANRYSEQECSFSPAILPDPLGLFRFAQVWNDTDSHAVSEQIQRCILRGNGEDRGGAQERGEQHFQPCLWSH
jgi:hypothetical protein